MVLDLHILHLKGNAVLPYINDLAKLRFEVFKSYPYLYAGELEYEKKYLQTYVECPQNIMIVVLDNKQIVGASTAIPLAFESDAAKKPFIDNQWAIEQVFYLGESVLLPAYRGRNVYRQFFNGREQAAKAYGSKYTAFCAVERPTDDARRPADYQPLDTIWKHFGYTKHPELCAYYEWPEIGKPGMTTNPLVFWIKQL